jgi:hypothetical protein
MSEHRVGPPGPETSRVCEVEMSALEAQLAAALVLMTAHERSGQPAEQRIALARKIGAHLDALAGEMRLSEAFRRIAECLGSQWAEQAGAQAAARRGRLTSLPAAPGLH